MNQKTLLVAIIAVVAVVIVIGVWVTGAGQSGPLSGDISGACVDPQLAAWANNGMVYTTIWAELKTPSGDPLPNQTLTIKAYDKEAGAYVRWGDYVTTDANGRFKVTRSGAPSRVPVVSYDGAEYNGICYWQVWVYCTNSAGVPVVW
jgi:hypothetical protein